MLYELVMVIIKAIVLTKGGYKPVTFGKSDLTVFL